MIMRYLTLAAATALLLLSAWAYKTAIQAHFDMMKNGWKPTPKDAFDWTVIILFMAVFLVVGWTLLMASFSNL